jgi:ABC-type bacteriocin/lantibiotic exporter with double-glycine peptidase domain
MGKILTDFGWDEKEKSLIILQHFEGNDTGDLYKINKRGLTLIDPEGKKSRLIPLEEFVEMMCDYIINDEEE